MSNTKIRVPAYERISMLTGRPLKIQYAINDVGALYRRLWVNPVIPFFKERDNSGRWDAWQKLGADYKLPADAKATGTFVVVRCG
jgi:hypothetical protein